MKRITNVALIGVCIILGCIYVLTGCNNEVASTAVPIAVVTDTPSATDTAQPTATSEPTNTPPPTDTATPLPTDTAEPSPTATKLPTKTPTPSPEPTDTPAATKTPRAAAVPPTTAPATAVPPTAPPPTTSTAYTFAETPIQPWNADTYVKYLGMVRDSFRSFNSEYQLFLTTDKDFDCGTFVGWTGLWILEAPGFTDVPAEWQPSYNEYRDKLRQIVSLTAEIRPLCNADGGEVSEETTMAILAFLMQAYPRLEQMVTETNQLPR